MRTLLKAILWPLRALAGLLLTAWTTPEEVAAGASYSSTDHNAQVVNNLLHLFLPPAAEVKEEVSTTTTTSTTFADVAGMSCAITTTGRDVLIGFHGQLGMSTAPYRAFVTVTRDGTNLGASGFGLVHIKLDSANLIGNVSFTFIDPEPAAGAHTYKIQWHVDSGGGTLTLYPTYGMFVREI